MVESLLRPSRVRRLLGPPNESIWQGVQQLPTSRPSSPSGSRRTCAVRRRRRRRRSHTRRSTSPQRRPLHAVASRVLVAEVVQHPERLNDAGLDLIAQMLKYTPNERIVAKDALEHPYFANLDKATVGTIPLPI